MIRRVTEKLGKSPMNKRLNYVLLDCGHDIFSSARLRVGSLIDCDKCETDRLATDSGLPPAAVKP
jgi:hypothetical protein